MNSAPSYYIATSSLTDPDFQKLINLMHCSFQERLDQGIDMGPSHWTAEFFKEKHPNAQLLVALSDSISQPLGMIAFEICKNERIVFGEIIVVAISPDFKNQGIASSLLGAAIKVLKQHNGQFLRSDTSILAKSSIRWHERMGFKKISLTSYPSTKYYSIIFRKDFTKSIIRDLYYFVRFPLSCFYTLITKRKDGNIRSLWKTFHHMPSQQRSWNNGKNSTILSIRDIQKESLSILRKVHCFCIENHIRYSLCYGTLIGAVRHRGFIPWDDDIDIIMPRPDYERFLSSFSHPDLGLLNPAQTGSYIVYARVYDRKRTVAISRLPFCKQYEGGVWIDIFPADAAEDEFLPFSERVGRLKQLFDKQIYLREAKTCFRQMPSVKKKIGLAIRKILRFNGWGIGNNNINMDQIARKFPYGSTNHWSQFSCMDDGTKMYQLLEDFQDFTLLEFEHCQFMAMKGYDRVLRTLYGDYMQLPPEEERIPHSSFVTFYWR